MPNPGDWHVTPRWIFWRPTRRRNSWYLDRTTSTWYPCWEYQHEAFVAREALENRFGRDD